MKLEHQLQGRGGNVVQPMFPGNHFYNKKQIHMETLKRRSHFFNPNIILANSKNNVFGLPSSGTG